MLRSDIENATDLETLRGLAAGRDKPAPVFNVGDKVTVKGITSPGIVLLAPRVSGGKYSVRLYANAKNVSAVADALRAYDGPLPKFFVGDNVTINGNVFGVVKSAPIKPGEAYVVKVADRHLTAFESELS